MRGAIFDLDGTLVDSLPGISRSLNRALDEHGFPTHSDAAIRGFVGNGIVITCRRALPAGTPDEVIHSVAQAQGTIYDELWRAHSAPFPGIPELLDTLLETGIAVGVCSNKTDPFTVEMVSALFPQIPPALVVGHREGAAPKPAPESALTVARAMDLPAEEIAFVGDSTVDDETARNAGMTPLLVTWGYEDPAALTATGSTLVDTVTALRQLIAEPRPA